MRERNLCGKTLNEQAGILRDRIATIAGRTQVPSFLQSAAIWRTNLRCAETRRQGSRVPGVWRQLRLPLILARLLLHSVFGPDLIFGSQVGGPSLRTRQTTLEKVEIEMTSGKTDELKGRVKEAAGALTGDAKLKREGRLDQKVGKAKKTSEKVIDKVRDAMK